MNFLNKTNILEWRNHLFLLTRHKTTENLKFLGFLKGYQTRYIGFFFFLDGHKTWYIKQIMIQRIYSFTDLRFEIESKRRKIRVKIKWLNISRATSQSRGWARLRIGSKTLKSSLSKMNAQKPAFCFGSNNQ